MVLLLPCLLATIPGAIMMMMMMMNKVERKNMVYIICNKTLPHLVVKVDALFRAPVKQSFALLGSNMRNHHQDDVAQSSLSSSDSSNKVIIIIIIINNAMIMIILP